MKRLLALILAGLTILSLSACGGYFGTNDNPPMKIAAATDDRP